MSDDTTQQGQQKFGTPIASSVFIPPAVQLSHGNVVELILKSESMNDEERQYWIDLLPIMTVEQVTQLQTILENERNQLAAIEAKYAENIVTPNPIVRPIEDIASERNAKSTARLHKEQEEESVESTLEQEILKQVEEV